MKKIAAALVMLIATVTTASAQAPDKLGYQATIRNAANSLLVNATVGMRISILQGSASGAAVYVETQLPVTNSNGLVTLEIGGGTVVSGSFTGIDWNTGPYFIMIETDPLGGTNYTITATSQLMSVPYAFAATKAKLADSAIHAANYWTLSNGNLYNNSGTNVAIGGAPDASHKLLVYDNYAPAIAVDNSSIVIGDVGGNAYGNYFLTDFETTPRFAFMGASVGIGTVSPAEKLDIASGNVRIPAANDYKYATAKTHYYSVPPASFQAEGSTYTPNFINGQLYLATGTTTAVGYLTAPVNLPDGATITGVTFLVVDNDGSYNPQPGQLWRNDASTSSSYGNTVQMANVPIPASSNSTLVQGTSTTFITGPTVDNQNYTYYLRWGTMQANANMRLAKVLITYTVTKAD